VADVAVDTARGQEAGRKTLIGQRVPKLDAPEKATGLARSLIEGNSGSRAVDADAG